jgi:hypothetical protein
MTREELTAHLIRVRESKLRSEVTQLQTQTTLLKKIEQLQANASSAAVDSATVAGQIRDLGLLGEIRLGCIKLAGEVASQVRVFSQRVTRAHKLTESARETHAALLREKQAAAELSFERESEHFFSWKRSSGRR